MNCDIIVKHFCVTQKQELCLSMKYFLSMSNMIRGCLNTCLYEEKQIIKKYHINQYFLKIVITLTRKCESLPLDEKPIDSRNKAYFEWSKNDSCMTDY